MNNTLIVLGGDGIDGMRAGAVWPTQRDVRVPFKPCHVRANQGN